MHANSTWHSSEGRISFKEKTSLFLRVPGTDEMLPDPRPRAGRDRVPLKS